MITIIIAVGVLLFLFWKCRHFIPSIDETPSSSGERRCREWLEARFTRSFPRVRPDWLRNPIFNKNLELDCFNEELRLAVEYNGRQHYTHVPYFHRDPDAFEYTKLRDQLKQELCRQAGVHLIVVPYYITDIEGFLDDRVNEWLSNQ